MWSIKTAFFGVVSNKIEFLNYLVFDYITGRTRLPTGYYVCFCSHSEEVVLA